MADQGLAFRVLLRDEKLKRLFMEDESFLSRLLADPAAASREAGGEYTSEELQSLRDLAVSTRAMRSGSAPMIQGGSTLFKWK